MISQALAQAQGGSPFGSGLDFLIPMVLIFVVFYFLLIRPQQKKVKEHREMLGRLKKNDEVVTSGGIYGKVVSLTDTVITLEVAPNVRIRVQRPQIGGLVRPEKVSAKEAKEQ